ncbi:ring-cleaving dioxygenase [Mesobacillus campisalis]|uniref:Ring-cleaving dioxygenase n=1 Tax=Mesobacillus campisalis TaxID=1408103 RepID=A0A0M2SXW1_9BACI|nr:ring-cleaving dioxygenase [Mesobacillus campisalis]KKK39399.1 ring-cleaving dioxygenase [Mesobacillus campisalis]
MAKKTKGIHHITAIVGHPQENVDFYAGVLGLRMVKKTVNFDDPGTYHFYFGNEEGEPGTIITFFPWAGAHQGRIGDGQVETTAYAIPRESLSFWEKRLKQFDIPFTKKEKFGEQVIAFEDPHGLKLELVEREGGTPNKWEFAGITPDVGIKGFAGATLLSGLPYKTEELLEIMGLEKVGDEGELTRFSSSDEIGNIIDLKKAPSGIKGSMGVGTVHHIAWRAEDDEDQLDWKSYIESNGFGVTPVQDRNYFNSIYFREYGDILFEIATDPPGFAHDESVESLGTELKLPEQYEQYRSRLEKMLIPVEVRELK